MRIVATVGRVPDLVPFDVAAENDGAIKDGEFSRCRLRIGLFASEINICLLLRQGHICFSYENGAARFTILSFLSDGLACFGGVARI